MRRAAAAIIGTIAGTTLLVGAKLGTHPPAAVAGDLVSGVDPTAPGAAAGSVDPAATGPTGSASAVPGQPSPTAGRTTGPTTPAGTRTTAPAAPPPTTAAASGLKNGTFTGSGVKERYGTITVSVTVSGGKITNASGSCAGCAGESTQISGNAFTRLRQETLSAQSSNIATVSGATYTSGAYKQSLQAAITAAHA